MIATVQSEHPPRVLARVRRAKCWRRTAWHEAGHAVASLLYGNAVCRLTLHPGGHEGRLGACRSRKLPVRPGSCPAEWTHRRVEQVMVVGLAGAEADRLLTGRPSSQGCDGDFARAVDVALNRCCGDEDETNALIARMQDRTRELMVANRDAVRRVAEALLASDRLMLSGVQVRAAAGELVLLASAGRGPHQ